MSKYFENVLFSKFKYIYLLRFQISIPTNFFVELQQKQILILIFIILLLIFVS